MSETGVRPKRQPVELFAIESRSHMPATAARSTTSFRDVLALAFKYKGSFITALVGPPAIAMILLFVLPAVYRAQTSLVVGTGPEYLAQGDGSSIITAPTTTKQEFVNTEIELLSNPAVVEETITHLGLANLYPDLLTSPVGLQIAKDRAIRSFASGLRVVPVKLSNVIHVTFDHWNPATAARALDQFIQSYQELHARVFAGRRSAGYEERIAHDMQDLENLERTRAETKASFGIYDLSQQRTALIQQRTEAEKHLQQTVDRADALSTRLAYLAQTRPHLDSEMLSSQTEANQAAIHASDMLLDLRQREAALAATYDPKNPLLLRVREQVNAAQRHLSELQATTTKISLSPSPITTAIDQDLVTSQAELAPLKGQELRDRILAGTIGQELQHIEQADMQLRMLDSRIADQNENLKIVRQLYDKARTEDEMDRAKVTAVVQASRATVPDRPVAPDHWLFMMGGIFSGLICAGGVLVFASVTNRTFISDESLERFIGLPVLGSKAYDRLGQRFLE